MFRNKSNADPGEETTPKFVIIKRPMPKIKPAPRDAIAPSLFNLLKNIPNKKTAAIGGATIACIACNETNNVSFKKLV